MILIEYVLPFLAIFTVVVVVHEMGHYLVARYNGVRVEAFGVGFGRELVGWTDRVGTRWRLNAIPVGGYVKMFGEMQPVNDGEEPPEMTEADRAVSFPHKRLGQRAAIVAAGPLANLIFAVVVFALMFVTMGQPVTAPVVGQVMADSAAAEAGLQEGDRITAVNGTPVDRFEDLAHLVQLRGVAPLTLTLERGGVPETRVVTPRMVTVTDPTGGKHEVPRVGIQASPEAFEVRHFGPIGATGEAVTHTWRVITGTFEAVGQIVSGQRSADQLGGPLRIAEFSGRAAQLGLLAAVNFIAILSINLGLINLFPVPLLDGGHLLFYAIEGVRGRPLTERAQEMGLRVGLALVLCLMLFVTWNDLAHWKVWSFLSGLGS